jgi:hypothetical protein
MREKGTPTGFPCRASTCLTSIAAFRVQSLIRNEWRDTWGTITELCFLFPSIGNEQVIFIDMP